ncbi:MAG: GNAT family N-acetyltransferase [Nibricoccus sp.]
MNITEFTLDHYDEVIALWKLTPGICIRADDSREATARYLARNPGLSFVAISDGKVVGSALSGHDGRRGYLQHVAVAAAFRKRGIAQALVARCLSALAANGITKTHVAVLADNDSAIRYWTNRGWEKRDDIVRFSSPCIS